MLQTQPKADNGCKERVTCAVVQACAWRCHGLFDDETLPELVIIDDTKVCVSSPGSHLT
jgi:hypothetical protein